MCLSSAVKPQARGLQSQTGGWPDAMVTQRLVGDRTGEKRQGPIPVEGQYTGETPNDFPHLREPGCSLVQEAQGPRGKEKTHLCSLFISVLYSLPKGCVSLLEVLSSTKVQNGCPVEGSEAPATDVAIPALSRCL